MPIVDRMEFPRRFKPKQGMVLLVILTAAFGIWYYGHSQKALARRIVIHRVKFIDHGPTYVRIGYDIENTGKAVENLGLIARVYDDNGEEIASLLFAESLPARTRDFRIKTLDKLARPLREGEAPRRATLEVLRKKLF
jgi:hypothetical protein